MTKPDSRQTLRQPIPAQSSPTAVKTPPRANGGPATVVLEPCKTCRWGIWEQGVRRCHLNPPSVRFPYDNMSAWPVVPETGGGCREWKEANP